MKSIQSNHPENVLSWILRAIILLVIFFYLLFSLDVFSENYKLGELAVAFFMHNLFTIGLAIILWIAWKKENIGGILLILLGIFMWFFFGGPSEMPAATWVLVGVPILVGILFLLNYYLIKGS